MGQALSDKYRLNQNQVPISADLPLKRLRRLEQRACSRINHFEEKLKLLKKQIEASQTNSYLNLNYRDTLQRVDFWKHRREQIQSCIVEKEIFGEAR